MIGRKMMLHQHYFKEQESRLSQLDGKRKRTEPRFRSYRPKSKGGGKRNFRKGVSARNAGPTRKEYVTKVVGLESYTFDIGHAKFAAKYQKTVKAIANHIEKDYKGGPEIAKAL